MLEKIIGDKRREVATLRQRASSESFAKIIKALPPPQEFRRALQSASQMAVIAEIKRKSPSRGVLNHNVDPAKTALSYQSAGATAVSVLTDELYFGGSLDDLRQVRSATELPILRKDFIIDELQLHESRAAGADAVLLIVAALNFDQLVNLHRVAVSLGLTALVEVHTESEAERAIELGANLIGINNRDLQTFEISLAVTERIAPLLPAGTTIVSESGIHTAADVTRVRKAGAHAVLVGQSLMTSADPAAKLGELLGSAV